MLQVHLSEKDMIKLIPFAAIFLILAESVSRFFFFFWCNRVRRQICVGIDFIDESKIYRYP
jgi:hypothetical protein